MSRDFGRAFWGTLRVSLLLAAASGFALAEDWPTVRHDLARSGRTGDCAGPPYKQAWVAVFEDEIITTRTEPIVAGGQLFVGTYSGRLHGLDAASGRELWSRDLEGPILHSPSVEEGVVYAASMAGVWALDAESGNVRWHTPCETPGYCTSPAVADGLVLLGGRDGLFRALDAATGAQRWTLPTGSPVRTTAAVADGSVYFASDDMHAYAADLKTGKVLWRSEKLFGQSMRDYYPVLAGDKVVLRSNPTEHFAARIAADTAFLAAGAGLPDAHWRTVADFLDSDRIFAPPETVRREQEAILGYLREHPFARSCFLLDRGTGRETVTAPVLYVGGCAGVANPPAVAPDGRLVIMYRTAYSNFTLGVAPMVGLGYLDVESGRIEPIYHANGRKPPWNTFWGTADEAQNFSVGGPVVYFSHQGTIGGLDTKTRQLFPVAGNRDTWGGLAAVGWTLNEWHGPARGSVAVVGDTLYWITGSRVIAVKGKSGETPDLPSPAQPTRADKLPVPPAQELSPELGAIRDQLEGEVRRIVDGSRWAPLRVEIGLGGCEYFFDHSGETLLALSLAAPHLTPDLRRRVVDYLRDDLTRYPPLTDGCWYPLDQGRRRESYRLSEELLKRDPREPRPHPFGNVYALWAFARNADQWDFVAELWPQIDRALADFRAAGWHFDPDRGDLFANRYLAALEAFERIAERFEHPDAAEAARRQADELAAGIVTHYQHSAESAAIPKFDNVQEFDRWRAAGASSFFFRLSGHKAKPAVFHGLTPEVGRLLVERAPEATQRFMTLVDRSLPGWYLAGEERQFHFGENYVDYPDFALAIFQARAYAEQAPAKRLARWIDVPWCPADLYYVQKLAIILEKE